MIYGIIVFGLRERFGIHQKGFRTPPAKDMGLMGQEGKRTSHKGLVRPPYGSS